ESRVRRALAPVSRSVRTFPGRERWRGRAHHRPPRCRPTSPTCYTQSSPAPAHTPPGLIATNHALLPPSLAAPGPRARDDRALKALLADHLEELLGRALFGVIREEDQVLLHIDVVDRNTLKP